jgi:hypothetical protein
VKTNKYFLTLNKMASELIEKTLLLAPFGLGVTNSILAIDYTEKFNIDKSNAFLGVSSASIALQTYAILYWFKYVIKHREGKITIKSNNPKYQKLMMYFWAIMMMFYILAFTTSLLGVNMVTGHHIVVEEEIQGHQATAIKGTAYTSLVLGGMALLVYSYAQITDEGDDHGLMTQITSL